MKLVLKNVLDIYFEWALSNSKLDMHFLSIRDGIIENVRSPPPQKFFWGGMWGEQERAVLS